MWRGIWRHSWCAFGLSGLDCASGAVRTTGSTVKRCSRIRVDRTTQIWNSTHARLCIIDWPQEKSRITHTLLIPLSLDVSFRSTCTTGVIILWLAHSHSHLIPVLWHFFGAGALDHTPWSTLFCLVAGFRSLALVVFHSAQRKGTLAVCHC